MRSPPTRRSPALLWTVGILLVGEVLAVGFAVRSAMRTRFEELHPFIREVKTAPVFPGQSVTIGGVQATIWSPGMGAKRPFPLVLFSHGFHESSLQSSYLLSALARHGYLVIAPTHGDSGLASKPEQPFDEPLFWTEATYRDRAQDIQNLVRGLRSDRNWNAEIDWSRLGLAGDMLGGYTVLGLAGARPTWKLPRVRAVLALSPYCRPYILEDSLSKLSVPVMYQSGTEDIGITPFLSGRGGAYDATPSPDYFVVFGGAGHFAWSEPNQRYADAIDAYAIAFFDEHVKRVVYRYPDAHSAAVFQFWSK